jgi:glyoxylase I family protein
MKGEAMKTVHVGLNCEDPIRIERFYTKYLGFARARVIHPDGGEQIVFINNGSFMLELFKTKAPSPLPPPEKDGYGFPGYRHIAFQVDNVDDILAKMGSDARISLGPFGFDDIIKGWRTVWIKDPEGNVVEISQGYSDQEDPPPLA